MKLISKTVINQLANKHGVDLNHGGIEYWQLAASTELQEHGHIFGENPDIAFQIAMDHIGEFPTYYEELYKMEDRLTKYWSKKKKPELFLVANDAQN